MVDVNFSLQPSDILSENLNKNLKAVDGYDQNNNFEDAITTNLTSTSIYNTLTKDEAKSDKSTIETKLELNIVNGQNGNDHLSQTEENKDSHTLIKHNLNIDRDISLVRIIIDSLSQRDQDINTEFNIGTESQASSDHFTDSGYFSSQSTIEYDKNVQENMRDISLQEYINVNNYDVKKEIELNTITVLHMDNIEKGINFERNHTDVKELKDRDYDDTNESICSGYHSSDFEFIDENEAKEVTIDMNELADTHILSNKRDGVINKEVPLNSIKGRKRKTSRREKVDTFDDYTNCQNLYHVIPEDEDFLTLFQAAPTTNLDTCVIQQNYNILDPGTSRSRVLGLQIERLNACKKYESEDDVRDAIEIKKNILSIYPRQNRFYKQI